jgi:hypothetical protein
MTRRYTNTGGDCQHCGHGWRLFECPKHPECGICRTCASGITDRVGALVARIDVPPPGGTP